MVLSFKVNILLLDLCLKSDWVKRELYLLNRIVIDKLLNAFNLLLLLHLLSWILLVLLMLLVLLILLVLLVLLVLLILLVLLVLLIVLLLLFIFLILRFSYDLLRHLNTILIIVSVEQSSFLLSRWLLLLLFNWCIVIWFLLLINNWFC